MGDIILKDFYNIGNIHQSPKKQKIFSELLEEIHGLRALSEEINDILPYGEEWYIGGKFFGKIDEKKNLIGILNSENDLFLNLFAGNIYNLEQTAEYPNFITFVSNASDAMNVYYSPDVREFYVAGRLIDRAFRLTPDKGNIEIPLPEITEEFRGNIEWIHPRYKLK